MPTCHNCGEEFRDFYVENETIYDFSRRKYRVNCRPMTQPHMDFEELKKIYAGAKAI